MSICDNCGNEVPNDLVHRANPYEKGLCVTYDINDTSAVRGWSRKKETVNFGAKKDEQPKKPE